MMIKRIIRNRFFIVFFMAVLFSAPIAFLLLNSQPASEPCQETIRERTVISYDCPDRPNLQAECPACRCPDCPSLPAPDSVSLPSPDPLPEPEPPSEPPPPATTSHDECSFLALSSDVSSRLEKSLSSSRPRVLVVLGTRPELVKLYPVIKSLRTTHKDSIDTFVVFSGQHRDLVTSQMNVFQIAPDLVLDLMKPNQDLAALSGRLFTALSCVVDLFVPSAVVVQGDTTTALVAGQTSFLKNIPLAHVEAGLRTKRLEHPYPEEMNRRVLGVLCRWCFAPTTVSAARLYEEGVTRDRVFIVGNTVVDAVLEILKREDVQIKDNGVEAVLSKVEDQRKKLVVITMHRRESFGEPMKRMTEAIRTIAEEYEDTTQFVVVTHPNPNVKEVVVPMLQDSENIELFDPLPYDAFVRLLEKAYLILTDSGGIQEEASALGVPVLTMREATERVEGILAGGALLVGTDSDRIIEEAGLLLKDEEAHAEMAQQRFPYGVGSAGQRIASQLSLSLVKTTKYKPPPFAPMTFRFDSDYPLSAEPSFDEEMQVEKGSITAIVAVYQRDYLDEILPAIYGQTHPPKKVFLWVNTDTVDVTEYLKNESYPGLEAVRSTYNFKFHGRFTLPLLMTTEYTVVHDDDLVPGKRWYENCVRVVNKHNVLCGQNGRLINPKGNERTLQEGLQYRYTYGQDNFVDFIGHIYFFRTEWARALWREPVPTFSTGEDMSFAAALQIHLGVGAMVPNHFYEDRQTHGSVMNWANDDLATWKTDKSNQKKMRFEGIQYWRQRGWNVLKERNPNLSFKVIQKPQR